MTKVQLEELREVIHPAGKLDSRAEHWAGRLYMRALSLRVTRLMLGTRFSPNQITTVMVFAGVLSGVALVVPGLGGAVLSVVFMQLYLLLDCVDGEVARWRKQFSPLGVYLDRLGAYLADAAVMVGMGIRAAELGLNLYLVAGLAAAIGVLLLKSSSDLVHVARSDSGMAKATDQSVVPRSSGLARVRRLTSAVGLHRLVNGIECTILLLVTAIADLALGDLTATKIATVAVTGIVWLLVPAHIISIVASSRLK
ncbi:CDP-alcohol phosphatidyltransferase family protein [Streptomyces sp. NPDC058467]|uniref:CDP-alcohol phosphatidyltransferase family protein n=1 Tax=unclassified Streptomyces TaxID=2593676 RepID=UPI003655DDB0